MGTVTMRKGYKRNQNFITACQERMNENYFEALGIIKTRKVVYHGLNFYDGFESLTYRTTWCQRTMPATRRLFYWRGECLRDQYHIYLGIIMGYLQGSRSLVYCQESKSETSGYISRYPATNA